MKIVKINYGIAFYCEGPAGKYIEINKNLFKYPLLWGMVLQHELDHVYCDKFWADILIDVKDMFNLKKQLMLTGFMIRHPMSILYMIPVFINNKRVSVNWFMGFYWMLFFIVFFIVFYVMLNHYIQ